VGLGVGGDVDGAGRGVLHPELGGAADLGEVGETHGHGEWQGALPAGADALGGCHEVGAGVAPLQHLAGVLLWQRVTGEEEVFVLINKSE